MGHSGTMLPCLDNSLDIPHHFMDKTILDAVLQLIGKVEPR
jgi:hypothetical protein